MRTTGPRVCANNMPSKIKAAPARGARLSAQKSRAPTKPKRVYKTRLIVARPDPLWTEWEDPGDFAAALDLHVRRHGETIYALHKALAASGEKIDVQTLYTWQRQKKEPRSTSTFRILTAIEVGKICEVPPEFFDGYPASQELIAGPAGEAYVGILDRAARTVRRDGVLCSLRCGSVGGTGSGAAVSCTRSSRRSWSTCSRPRCAPSRRRRCGRAARPPGCGR